MVETWRSHGRQTASKAHRRAVEQGQCFHHRRSFFHSSRRRRIAPLSPSFYAFLAAKDPLSSSCRWVPSAGRYQCRCAVRAGGRTGRGFCKSPFFPSVSSRFAYLVPRLRRLRCLRRRLTFQKTETAFYLRSDRDYRAPRVEPQSTRTWKKPGKALHRQREAALFL